MKEFGFERFSLGRRKFFIGHLTRELGGMVLLGTRAFARIFQPPLSLGNVAYQVEMLGAKSMSIALLTAVFAGLVISLQFAFFMARFGVQHSVGRVVVLTLFRELGPVLIALTVGSRVGSGMTAELGSMKVTEQLDAIRALGADPIKKLVTPRVLACLLVFPALTVLADVVGLIAGSWVVKAEYGLPFKEFFRSAIETATLLDFTSGIGKSVVFGGIIGVVGCYKGFTVRGGTEGVGRATTETVAITSVVVCLSDFFLTKLFLSL
ncbi:MAG: ABC transporter permease [Proteobacteria bacterium]|nr:ABC transporter permease [Cystobacterineae bacterium]MCL2313744.1 ABC transporter permease [Pseudomonadota bacterium]